MKKMRNNMLRVVSSALVMSMLLSNVVFAGEWKQEGSTWKYQNDDGSLAKNTWQWINGKSYCFDGNGVMYSNTTTPDGYTVNADGAWTVNGVVQEQTKSASVVDDQYPLAHLQKYFDTNTQSYLDLNWSYRNVYSKYHVDDASTIIMDNAVAEKDVFVMLSNMQGECLLAIAKLAGVPLKGFEDAANDSMVVAIENELRSFLNSFDWRNASDYEKAVAIAKKVNEAKYDNTGEYAHLPYGCLVEKKASCDGFTNTAKILGMCVDLPVTSVVLGYATHAFAVYNIDGVWFSHEATSHNNFFLLYDYHDALQKVGDDVIYIPYVEYCMKTGYEVPDNDYVFSHFSNARGTGAGGRAILNFN